MKIIAAFVAALLVGANAVPLKLYFNRAYCKEKMVGLNFEFRTDQYPDETTITIENEDGYIVFEWGPFSKGERVYTTDDDACPGKYKLIIEDSQGDGLGHSYGELVIAYNKGNKKLIDKTLGNFGSQYTKIFRVEGDSGGNTSGNTSGNTNTGGGVFGCGGSMTTKNCRCCKDKCEDKYGRRLREGRQLMTVKECKRNKCRSYYGRKTCKD